MNKNYDDIINLPHIEMKNHKRGDRASRAAQFGAFRALSGFEDEVNETARYTEGKILLTESEIETLNEKISLIKENKDGVYTIKYFVPDSKKQGGKYVETKDKVKKIDAFKRIVITNSGVKIPIDMILSIE